MQRALLPLQVGSVRRRKRVPTFLSARFRENGQTAMAYAHTKALVASFAKFIQWLAMSKRMFLIVSPFLAIVAILVWLAIVSIDILAAGRAYVEGESLWSKNQKEAVFHLLRFAETRSESDFRSYQKAIMVPLGSRGPGSSLKSRLPTTLSCGPHFSKVELIRMTSRASSA